MWHRNRVQDHSGQAMRMIGVGRPIGPVAMPLAANSGVRSALTIFSKESIQLFRPRVTDLTGNPVPVLSLELGGQCVVVVVTVVMHRVYSSPPIWIQFGKRPGLVEILRVEIYTRRGQVDVVLCGQLGSFRSNIAQAEDGVVAELLLNVEAPALDIRNDCALGVYCGCVLALVQFPSLVTQGNRPITLHH